LGAVVFFAAGFAVVVLFVTVAFFAAGLAAVVFLAVVVFLAAGFFVVAMVYEFNCYYFLLRSRAILSLHVSIERLIRSISRSCDAAWSIFDLR
jgi:hypothetical protein